MFRPHVDYAPYRERLLANSRVQIPNILDDAYAAQFHEALSAETEWELAYQVGAEPKAIAPAEYAAMDAQQRAEFLSHCARDAAGKYAYAFDNYAMSTDAGERSEHLLHRLVDIFHYAPVLDFVRALTGDPGIARVRIQATRYLSGHFLRRHDDSGYETQKRRFAFVFNLGRGWQADWGGLLHFLDAEGRVVDTFVPSYNSLSLFKVPQYHCVSQVAAWAQAPRYALTGWFIGD
jgi:Rps23 Pro-64 3,4-dihydroxylase Tpa1-like proline 4-hydroxylase